ncbi:MAG: InlB B-repeat-containing protein [Clostridia bacterium]|nr:InlB B-repeat-containing protein [Clostridia bacterium]
MKKKGIIKLLIATMLVLSVMAILVACGGADVGYDNGDSNGGSSGGGSSITVTFMDRGDVIKTSSSLDVISSFEPDPRIGYDFAGWYYDEAYTQEFDGMPTKSVIVYAKWEIMTFVVTFYGMDDTIIPVNGQNYQEVTFGGSAVAPTAPEVLGYDFVVWMVDGEEISDFSYVTSDLIVVADYVATTTTRVLTIRRFEPIVTIDEEGVETIDENVKREEVRVGSEIATYINEGRLGIEEYLCGGLAFVEWYLDEDLTELYAYDANAKMPNKDLTLYPKVVIEDIEGLALTSSRTNFKYDLGGFQLQAKFYDNIGLTYSYDWYNHDSGKVKLAGTSIPTYNIDGKGQGNYRYSVTVTVSYKELESKTASAEFTVTVLPGSLGDSGISSEATSQVYDGKMHTPSYKGLIVGDTLSYRVVVEGEDPDAEKTYTSIIDVKDVGTYKVETLVERPNYDPLVLEATLVEITPATLTVTADNKSMYYGDLATIRFTATYKGFIDGEDQNTLGITPSITCEIGNGDVGYYPIIVSGITLKNYNVVVTPSNASDSEAIEKVSALYIAPKIIYASVRNLTQGYGADIPEYTLIVESSPGIVLPSSNGDYQKLKNGLDFACDYFVGAKAGRYDIDLQVKDNADGEALKNYDIQIEPGMLTVTKANLTITVDSENLVYGAQKPDYGYSAVGFVNGENLSDFDGTLTLTCAYEQGSNVGSYSITASGLTSDNYNVAYIAGKVTVTKAPLNIAINKINTVYGNSAPTAQEYKSQLTYTGFVAGDDESALNTANAGFSCAYAPGSNAGQYKITIYGFSSVNYAITYTHNVLEVARKPLAIKVNDISLVYGEALPLVKDLTVGEMFAMDEIEDVIPNAVFDVSGYMAGSAIGSYAIALKQECIDTTNYDVTATGGTITVAQRELVVHLRAYASVIANEEWLGSLVDNSLNTATHFEIDNLYNTDRISAGVLSVSRHDFGSYAIKGNWTGADFSWATALQIKTGSDEDVKDNYSIIYDVVVAIGTYGKIISDYEAAYDGEYHSFVVEEDEDFGFNSGGFDIVTEYSTEENGVYTTEPIEFKNVGSYTVWFKLYDNNNPGEGVLHRSQTITITPALLSINVDDATVTYGEAPSAQTFTVNGFVPGEAEQFNVDMTVGYGDYVVGSPVGEYAILPVESSVVFEAKNDSVLTSNYKLDFVAATLTVEKRALTVTASDLPITYGDRLNYKASFVGLASVDSALQSALPQFACDYTASPKAGTFTIVPHGLYGDKWSNYEITYVNGELSVAKKIITLSAPKLSIEYGSDTPVLKAVASTLVNGDTVDTIGTISLTTAYVKGNDVNSYVINITATSDKYEFGTPTSGLLTVVPKKVSVSWTGIQGVDYVYNGNDRSSDIGATFMDVNGHSVKATVSFSANNSTPNMFKNAGAYAITASTSNKNYELLNATNSKSIAKADYTNVPHNIEVYGVYAPDQTLGSLAFNSISVGFNPSYYTWATTNTVPTCDVQSYGAYFNADSENYNSFAFDATVILRKATVGILQNSNEIQEFTFVEANCTAINGTYTLLPTIYYRGSVLNSSLYTLSFSKGTNVFTAGTHKSVMSLDAVNYELKSEVTYIVKYKAARIGTTYYTIEDALNVAKSGDKIYVTANSTFGSYNEVAHIAYASTSYYTVKAGVNVILPYNASDTRGYNPGATEGDSDFDNLPLNYLGHATDLNRAYLTLTVPSDVTIYLNGSITIGAYSGSKQAGGVAQNGISEFSRLILNGKIIAMDASINAYGYIDGSGNIVAKGATVVTETFHIPSWPGGTHAVARYIGNTDLSGMTFVSGGSAYTPKNVVMFPFAQYVMDCVRVTMELNYGSSLRGYIKIATSAQSLGGMSVVKAMLNETHIALVNSSTDKGSGILRMLNSSTKITRSYLNGKLTYKLDGSIADGYSTLSLKVLNKNVNVSSEKVMFPIDGSMDIVINSGSFTQDYQWKMLPGANLKVNAGASYVLNGSVATLPQGYKMAYNGGYPNYADAKLIIDGNMTANGTCGATIVSTASGRVVLGASAKTSVTVKDGTGDMQRSGLTIKFTLTESNVVTRSLTLVNASGTTAVTLGKTYVYTAGSWAQQ